MTEYKIPFKQIDLYKVIQEKSELIQLPPGKEIIRLGQYIKVIPIVLNGAINVYRRDETGQELFLYSINTNESCAMTLQSCYNNQPSEIYAITSIETEILAIPANFMDTWINKFPEWKLFVINSFTLRFKELLNTIDSIAFHKLDERLIEYLHKKSVVINNKTLSISHKTIAIDLNSSREVISRLLKQLEQQGKVTLGRNKIKLM